METDFRRASPEARQYLKAAALFTAFAAVLYVGLRQALPPAGAAAGTALTNLAELALATLLARAGLLAKGERAKEANAAVILPLAVAAVGACFGAAHANGNGLYLFAGFMLGVAYGVYGLVRNIDDLVTARTLLAVTMAQVAVLFILIG